MKFYTFLFISLFTLTMNAQSSAKDEVKATIEKFFDGFHKGDTTIIKSTLANQVVVQTAFKNGEGKDILNNGSMENFLKAIATRPEDQKWDERLLSYSIQVDGNMANAWTPYEFWFNGEFRHCGVNSFQLFKDNGTWKIIYLIDTRRRAGCKD
ncbi:nuclear transport factor 2 family protein [Flavobacteriaceae bacterium R38]|nr:nuclear transport factor 2 family protein [Flavobacteriaceae bacterium R38]